jgi:hypothetical protein
MEESAREDAEDSLKLSELGGGGGAGDKFALIGYSETQWVRAFLPARQYILYFTTEIHISIQTFIFQEKTGLDAKAFLEKYINHSRFAVCDGRVCTALTL